ncbi:CHC2 zinc finger domain-containing protein [Cesiribacter sp. SM1]|uniref:CHC2 zinc finger domain-containing protein n=1 Tax=Cesiribacter sp. SM1 TaxID=2861196 RepID=UPI001CD4BE1A
MHHIKQQLSIDQVLAHYGLKADRNGRLCCPFHADKTPSLQVYAKTNTFCCFSANCQAGTGDVIDFIQLKEKSSKHAAILKAKELTGSGSNLVLATPEKEDLPRRAVLLRFWQGVQKSMAASKRAREYAAGRNLDWQKLEIGFAGEKLADSWNEALKKSALQLGLLHAAPAGKLEPKLKDCLVFPLKDKEGQPVSFYGRSILENSTSRHFYLKDRQGLYPNYPKADTTHLILTESVIDAATLLQNESISSRYSILALYGTNGLSAEHLEAIKSLEQLQEVILFLDGDGAGRAAAEKHEQTLQQLFSSLRISQVETPEGEDINSLLEAHAPEVLQHLLESRTGFFLSSEKEQEQLPQPQLAPQQPNTPAKESPLQADRWGLYYATSVALYRISGSLPQGLESLKVSLAIECLSSNRKYRSKPDLFEEKQVVRAAREAAEKLDLPVHLLQQGLEELTDLLEEHRREQIEKPKHKTSSPAASSAIMQKGLELLQKPQLLKELNQLIGKAGVVGEERTRLFLLPVALSYKTDKPLHALLQGSSGSGKTHLLSKLSSFIAEEDRKHFTRITESSLYNWGSYELQNKLICLEDLDGLKEEALLAFRELQSRGQISSSTSVKDEQGNISAQTRTVYGPIASLACTTKGEIYEDNLSRCFLVAVDESREQTRKIIDYQNKKAAGLIDAREEEQARQLLEVALGLVKPLPVLNPYATKLQLPEAAHKQRRLNELYQSYVQQLTLLHQYQRQKDKQGRLVAQKEDLLQAAHLMFDTILLKVDELNGPLRQFFEQLKSYLRDRDQEFSQREVRQALHISKTQLQRFLYDLMQLEYIQLSGGYGNRGYRYRISYWDSLEALKAQIKQHIENQLEKL